MPEHKGFCTFVKREDIASGNAHSSTAASIVRSVNPEVRHWRIHTQKMQNGRLVTLFGEHDWAEQRNVTRLCLG